MSPIDRATLERMAFKSMNVPDGTPCPRCGYELTGLSPDGQCPECGSPIEFALRPDYLRYSAHEYVSKLHLGALLVVLGFVGMILIVLLNIFLGFTVGLRNLASLALILSLAVSVLSLVGWWLLSSPDPGKAGVDLGASSRKILRVLLIIKAAGALFNLVVATTGLSFTLGSLVTIVGVVEQLTATAAFIVSMLYLKTLAYRMPSEHIAKHSKTVLWLAVVLFVLTIIIVAGGAILIGAGGGGGMAVFGCLVLPMAVMWIVFLVMYLFLLDRTRRALKEILDWM